jgi:D-threonine aldolase
MQARDLPTPSLVVDATAFAANVATMSAERPGRTLRPHVKAFKSTALAKQLAAAGHDIFCCATTHEVEGMAAAGLGADLLLANQSVDPVRMGRLGQLVADGTAAITVAIDSPETLAVAAEAGIRDLLIDLYVGLPRCGVDPSAALALADLAREAGCNIRGVMGYEGHLMHVIDRDERTTKVAEAMEELVTAHHKIGGELISGGGTGSYDINHAVNEIQAGSYTLMDGEYGKLNLPFQRALAVVTTVISLNRSGGWAVLDGGLKALALDHGNPSIDSGDVMYCSDEHTVYTPHDMTTLNVGDRVIIWPRHIDPTIAKHAVMHVANRTDSSSTQEALLDSEVVDQWAIDLLHW